MTTDALDPSAAKTPARDVWERPVRVALCDGTEVLLRGILPADRDALRAGYESLSPESRYRRFFTDAPNLSEETLRYLTEVDGVDHVALVAVAESPDLKSETGLGVARFIRLSEEPAVAEVAVVVADEHQRRGLARVLLAALAECAYLRGVKRFRVEVLAENAPMRSLLATLGVPAPVATDAGVGPATVAYDLDLALFGFDPAGDAAGATGPEALRRLLRDAAASLGVLLRWLGRGPRRSNRPPAPEGASLLLKSAEPSSEGRTST